MIDIRDILPPLAPGDRIGIDVDGVVIDIIPAILSLYNRDYGDSLCPDDILDWNMVPFVKPECGPAIYRYFASGEMYEQTSLVPGAIGAIAELREMGLRPLFITSSFDGQGDPKRAALRRLGVLPDAKTDPLAKDLWQTADKDLVPVRLLIDDYVGNLEGVPFPAILFPAAYNAQHADTYRRANGWGEIITWIRAAWSPHG